MQPPLNKPHSRAPLCIIGEIGSITAFIDKIGPIIPYIEHLGPIYRQEIWRQ